MEDGIFEEDDERRRRELRRRAYLNACAETLRAGAALSDGRVHQAAMRHGLDASEVPRLRTEFVRRQILDEENASTQGVHVPFFQRWLETEGPYKLPPRGISEQAAHALAEADEHLRVSPNEVGKLVRRWGSFKFRSEAVTRDSVEQWLEQFESPVERRLAFRLLERLQVVTDADVFQGFRRLHRLVAQETQLTLRPGQRALSHIYVAAIGGAGSSGEAFAYTYRQANSINANNVVRLENLIELLGSRHEVTTVILVDDFIGSGGTAQKAIRPLAQRAGELAARPDVGWYLFAVTGVPQGVRKVGDSLAGTQLGLPGRSCPPAVAGELSIDGT